MRSKISNAESGALEVINFSKKQELINFSDRERERERRCALPHCNCHWRVFAIMRHTRAASPIRTVHCTQSDIGVRAPCVGRGVGGHTHAQRHGSPSRFFVIFFKSQKRHTQAQQRAEFPSPPSLLQARRVIRLWRQRDSFLGSPPPFPRFLFSIAARTFVVGTSCNPEARRCFRLPRAQRPDR